MPLIAHFAAQNPLFALPLVLGTWVSLGVVARSTEAGPISTRVSYETAGTIDSAGVTGAPIVRFVAAGGGTDSATPFSLGAFEVEPTSPGSVTRYSQTPVTISYWTRAINGISTTAEDGTAAAPMMIHGWLSGTVGGANRSALSVIFDQGLQPDDPRFYQPRPLPPFPAGSSLGSSTEGKPPGYLSLNNGQSLLALATTGGALTPIPAAVDLTANVPEPTSLMIFLAATVSLGVGRRFRRV